MQARELEDLNARFEEATVEEILLWAWTTFQPAIGATTSFQTQSVPLLHMIARTIPAMPGFFIDTGFHFPETLAFRNQLVAAWGLQIQTLSPTISHAAFLSQYGELYRFDPDRCCAINKVQPWQQARKGLRAWISGIRRDQTEQRRQTRIIERQSDGVYKIAPLARWTRTDICAYLDYHNLPRHPLRDQGYMSVGCAPCTQPVGADEDERAGRWNGFTKIECGLHTP